MTIIVNPLSRLTSILGYEFTNTDLLQQALTHRSCKGKHNERLEFLGDAILSVVIADALFQYFPNAKEGELTRMRASLVKGVTLAEIAGELSIANYLRLGPGEMKSGGHRRESILADAFEAILGAIYLDAGLDVCKARILHWFDSRLVAITPQQQKDSKTRLQEYLQGRRLALPVYVVETTEGEAHNQHFTVSCRIEGHPLVEASGSSRRKAEQDAAHKMLEYIQNEQ